MRAERKAWSTREELMKLWIEAEVLRLTNIRASQNRKVGVPGPEGSTGKLAFAESNKRIYDFAVSLMGADGMLYSTYEMHRPETAMASDSVQKAFLRSRANSIEGGTSEVMRNILGERVLGLPGDVRVDRDSAWKDVPRNGGTEASGAQSNAARTALAARVRSSTGGAPPVDPPTNTVAAS